MEQNKFQHLSCVDCGKARCINPETLPEYCLTGRIPPEVKADAMAQYETEENRAVMAAAADVELTGYCKWPRVREVMEFAKRMGYTKIGIATCVGLLNESRMLAKLLRSHGFEVFGMGCKAGTVPKTDVGIDPKNCAVGCNMCNPILQAKMLSHEGTQLNIVMGLCVGHDSLFYKYSEAVTTTLVVKDRVTGHNPVAALYTSESFYKSLFDAPAER